MKPQRYLLFWLLALVGFLTVAVAVNIIVDPYGIMGTERLQGFNAVKPAALTRNRTAKIHQALRVRPRTIIAGNSRPELGLDPHAACFPEALHPVFNASIAGASVKAQLLYAQHAAATGDADTILVGLDFLDFLVSPDEVSDPHVWPPRGSRDLPLLVDFVGNPRPAFRWEKQQDILAAALSLDALRDSLGTVLRQKDPFAETLTEQGFVPGERVYGPTVQYEGSSVLFAQKYREVAQRLTAKRWSLYHQDSRWSASFEALSRFLRRARDSGQRAIPFINPYHADYLLLIDLAGQWPLFEEWKRGLAEIVARDGSGRLWDFNEFSAFTTESVTNIAAKGQALEWFWEPAHYRQELGNKMLARMILGPCQDSEESGGFGEMVTGGNLNLHLAELRQGLAAYKAANPESVRELLDLVRDIQSH